MILIIDDEPEYVKPQKAALEDAGYQVRLAVTPDAAIQYLKSDQVFDLIILDILMPPSGNLTLDSEVDATYTGVHLHREIRRMGIDSPILFVSVVRDKDIIARSRTLETRYKQKWHFLQKPVLPSRILDEVKNILLSQRRGIST